MDIDRIKEDYFRSIDDSIMYNKNKQLIKKYIIDLEEQVKKIKLQMDKLWNKRKELALILETSVEDIKEYNKKSQKITTVKDTKYYDLIESFQKDNYKILVKLPIVTKWLKNYKIKCILIGDLSEYQINLNSIPKYDINHIKNNEYNINLHIFSKKPVIYIIRVKLETNSDGILNGLLIKKN